MMKIIILGATGFLGKNLLKYLQYNFVINAISLRSDTWVKDMPKSDVFINLVGKAHDHGNKAEEKDFFYVNFELTKGIFNAFINSDAKLFIHVSSLAALEEFESKDNLTENDRCNPVSWYGKSKRVSEEWLLAQKLPSDKKLIIIRPPMVHGPGDKGNLGLLYKLISKGIPYPLASFENKRSFISIDNFCFIINEIIEKRNNLSTGIYHVSDDEPLSTNQIISVIKKVEKKKILSLNIPKVFVKAIAKLGDIIPIPLNSQRLKKMTSNLTLSNQKIKSALGIEKLPLSAEEGLIKTIESFKNN